MRARTSPRGPRALQSETVQLPIGSGGGTMVQLAAPRSRGQTLDRNVAGRCSAGVPSSQIPRAFLGGISEDAVFFLRSSASKSLVSGLLRPRPFAISRRLAWRSSKKRPLARRLGPRSPRLVRHGLRHRRCRLHLPDLEHLCLPRAVRRHNQTVGCFPLVPLLLSSPLTPPGDES